MFVRQDGSTPLGNSTIKLTGTLNTGTISLPVSYNTVDPSDTAAAGWCFVGNPYASEIDWENAGWTKTDVADGIYVWDAIGGLYRTFVNNVPLNGGSPVISSGQSFWVRAIASSADLQVTEQVKTTTVGTFSKPTTTPDNLLYVTIRDGQDEAEMALRFMEEATSKYDPAYDGYYFGGTSPVNLCTYDDDYVYYAVNSLPLSSDTEVPVYIVHPDEERSYELQFDNLGSFEDDPGLKLVDLYLGETMDLFDGFVYEFDYDGSPSSNGASRFVIQKTTPTITSDVDGNEVEPEGFRVFPNPVQGEDVVSVLLPFDSNGELKVIDIEGRVIFSEIISSISSYNMVLEDLQSGVYLVSYVTDSSQFSERLIVE